MSKCFKCPVCDIEVEDDIHVLFWMCSSLQVLVVSRFIMVIAYCSEPTRNNGGQGVCNVQKRGQCDGRESNIVILVHLVTEMTRSGMTVFSHRLKLEEWRSPYETSGLSSTSCSVILLFLLRILGHFCGRNQEWNG
jgi:hypothetical protein